MALTLAAITDAITDTLGAAAGMARQASEARGEIVESPPPGDMPLLQVTWAGLATSGVTALDRRTFQAAVRVPELIWHADVITRQRSYIGEDMLSVITMCDAVYDILEQQTTSLFGLAGIKQFRWDAEPVLYDYGDPQVKYVGIRFILTLWVY